MKAIIVELTLNDLQEALTDYCAKQGFVEQPEGVIVHSRTKQIVVNLRHGELIIVDEFKHKSKPS